MARIRTIKPEFFLDDDLARLHPLTRILFQGLWCLADCAGRLEDRPTRIKVQILPYDKHDIDAALDDLHAARFITRYKVDGNSYIQVRSFSKHQRISGKEAQGASTIPEAPIPQGGSTGEAPEKQSGSEREATETTGKERKGKERSVGGQFSPPLPQEVKAYCLERKNTVDPQKFIDHYTSNGWKVGKNPMKDWRASVRTWEKSDIGGIVNGRNNMGRNGIQPKEISQPPDRSNQPGWFNGCDISDLPQAEQDRIRQRTAAYVG